METTIMLVDDSEICNLMMKKVLSRQPMPLKVYDFTEPVVAFSQLKQINPSVLFLDLNMPDLDGWGFLELMRDSGLTNRVIILTSSTSQLDRVRCAEFPNVVAYHTKPLSHDMVRSLMASLQPELS
ncbi:response regulator [Spirosoma rigui]|uniref:response regulator n=1 Tax=Spirosoma rigui TaxID=564064 RepID=UPI0009B0757C|nr:response regulator [Spirosoma rigui]